MEILVILIFINFFPTFTFQSIKYQDVRKKKFAMCFLWGERGLSKEKCVIGFGGKALIDLRDLQIMK
jgi:hypothetical protein